MKNFKFFEVKTGESLTKKADDFSKYENLMLDSLMKSSELTKEISKGTAISEMAKSVWMDLFDDKSYQITVFDTDTIKGISLDLFKEYFEAVTSSKCRCLSTIPNLKKSEKYGRLKDALTGLKSGAYKDPVFQCIVRSVTTLANKNGGNKPKADILATLCQALETSSKIGVRDGVKDNKDLIALIKSELASFEQAILKGEQFTNNHKKK